jgi:hypothetical protein
MHVVVVVVVVEIVVGAEGVGVVGVVVVGVWGGVGVGVGGDGAVRVVEGTREHVASEATGTVIGRLLDNGTRGDVELTDDRGEAI